MSGPYGSSPYMMGMITSEHVMVIVCIKINHITKSFPCSLNPRILYLALLGVLLRRVGRRHNMIMCTRQHNSVIREPQTPWYDQGGKVYPTLPGMIEVKTDGM